jgi:hypothetical protein
MGGSVVMGGGGLVLGFLRFFFFLVVASSVVDLNDTARTVSPASWRLFSSSVSSLGGTVFSAAAVAAAAALKQLLSPALVPSGSMDVPVVAIKKV